MAKPTKHGDKWRIRWIDETGKRRSEVYEMCADAEFHLGRHQTHVREIKRGLRTAVLTDKTVGEAFDYWIEHRAPGKRSGKDDLSIIARHLRPAFGHVALRDLSVRHVDQFKAAKRDLSPKTVHNLLTLLIAVLHMAVDLGWLRSVPKIKKPRIKIIDREYRYLRTKAELHRFLRAADAEGPAVHALYATAVYTGMRAGELAGLAWSDVDFDRRVITVRHSYEGPTKSGEPRDVPILDPLLPVLRRWKLRHPGRLVFTNRDGRMFGESARVFQEVLHRVLRRAGFPEERVNGKMRRYITFHGLRHSFASHWMMDAGDLFKLQRILGHQTADVTQRYSHLAPNAFAGDYGRLGSEPSGVSGSVAPFPEPVADTSSLSGGSGS